MDNIENIEIKTDTVIVSKTINKDDYVSQLQTSLDYNLGTIDDLNSQIAGINLVNDDLRLRIKAANA